MRNFLVRSWRGFRSLHIVWRVVIVFVVFILVIGSFGGSSEDKVQQQTHDQQQVAEEQSRPTSPQLRHSYEDFYEWITSTGMIEYKKWYNPATYRNINTYNTILYHCGFGNGMDDNEWVSCMQEAYDGYLKPETFTSEDNYNDFLNMVGIIQSVQYGYYTSSDVMQNDVMTAKAIYAKLAATD